MKSEIFSLLLGVAFGSGCYDVACDVGESCMRTTTTVGTSTIEAAVCYTSTVCEAFAGVNGCVEDSYTLASWIPNCDGTGGGEDQTGIAVSIETACCSSDTCDAEVFQGYSCVADNTFKEYNEAVTACYEPIYHDLMVKAICPDVTECSETVVDKLKEYVTCVCAAADASYPNTDVFTGTSIEATWNAICTNLDADAVDTTCISTTTVTSWVITLVLRINLAANKCNDEFKGTIKVEIANRLSSLGVTTSSIEIECAESGGGRRLLVDQTDVIATFTTEDESSKEYAETNMDDQLAIDIGTAINATTIIIEVSSEEVSDDTDDTDDTENTDDTDGAYGGAYAANLLNVNIISLGTIFITIAAFFN